VESRLLRLNLHQARVGRLFKALTNREKGEG